MGFSRFQYLFIVIFCCGIWQGSSAQSLSTTVSKNNILIGEQIKYRLSFNFPENDYQIEFNVPDSFPHFEILDKRKFDSTHNKGFYIVQDILLTSWDSGAWQIPSLPIKLKKISTNRVYDFASDSFNIKVGYAPADGADTLRDVKPIRGVSFVDDTWIYFAIGMLLALILIYFIWRYFKNRPKKIARPTGKAAYEEAMSALNKLRQTKIDTQDSAKAFYTALGAIFKQYYQKKSTQNLDNKTTAEVVAMLRRTEPMGLAADFVQEALGTGDAAKFAKYLPAAEENDKCCDFVANAIERIEQLSKENTK